MSEKKLTQVVLGTKEYPVRFSYVTVFKAEAGEDGGTPKFSTAILIDKRDKVSLAKANAAIEAAKLEGKASKWGGKIPKNLKIILRDGDQEKDDEIYEGMMFMSARTTRRPTILDENKEEILDPEDFYSGCYGRVSVNFFPYNTNGNGVTAGLNNCLKLKDGDRLGGGGTDAQEDFADDDDDMM